MLQKILAPNYLPGGGGHDDVIWWLWFQGEDNAPPICKTCLKSLRRWYPEKKIIVLDKDNLSGYITLPDHIEQKHKDGKISNAHYSDIVRAQLLIEHGGTWIDATVYCTGREHYEHVMHLPLFVFRDDTPSRPLSTWIPTSNWFIVSDPHDPIIELTQKLLLQYWKDYDYAIHYFIFHMFFRMAAGAYLDEYNKIPFISNQPSFAMQNGMYDDYSEEKMKK